MQHYCLRDILDNFCQKPLLLGICLDIVNYGFESLTFYMNIMSHVKYQLFCSLDCHIICFYFNVPAVLYFGTFVSCCAMEDCCRSICIFDFLVTFPGFAIASSCTLTAYKFKNAFLRNGRFIHGSHDPIA